MPLDAMDFRIDVTNPNKSVDADKHALYALRSIRRGIAEFGWYQGGLHGRPGSEDRCFIGWAQYYGLNDDEQRDFCDWYIVPALPKRFREMKRYELNPQSRVIRYNDAESTTRRSILRMIDRAIALIPEE